VKEYPRGYRESKRKGKRIGWKKELNREVMGGRADMSDWEMGKPGTRGSELHSVCIKRVSMIDAWEERNVLCAASRSRQSGRN
jgi:hypothetical protein